MLSNTAFYLNRGNHFAPTNDHIISSEALAVQPDAKSVLDSRPSCVSGRVSPSWNWAFANARIARLSEAILCRLVDVARQSRMLHGDVLDVLGVGVKDCDSTSTTARG